MLLNATLGCLALLSLALLLWQWLAARRFPLHRRIQKPSFCPSLTLLKPLKGADETTEQSLRSWFEQTYPGPVQILFGVASGQDPVCTVVERLIREFPVVDARLQVCGLLTGANLKVSKLAELEKLAKHELLVISDADVRVPPDLLSNAVAPLEQTDVALVNCFYRLANAGNLAMRWEALAVNADFWSQVLQAQTLKPLDFALGAVMLTRRGLVRELGGFEALADCLADDYELGHRLAVRGHRLALCPVVVECWSSPQTWPDVWKHQLRWARTIRVCQPAPYFFSVLSNATLCPLLWLLLAPSRHSAIFLAICLLTRIAVALHLESLLTGKRAADGIRYAWLAPIKDLLQTAIWALAFLGKTVEWRGEKMRLQRDGTLVRVGKQSRGGLATP